MDRTDNANGPLSSAEPPTNHPPQTGLIAWFATNHVAANLLMILIIVVGAISAFNIKRDLQPDLTIDIVQVSVIYPGASPSEVEQGVAIKIEDVIQDIEGIEEFSSYSMENAMNMYIDVLKGFDVSDVMNEVKNRVDGAVVGPGTSRRHRAPFHGVLRDGRVEVLQEDLFVASPRFLADVT